MENTEIVALKEIADAFRLSSGARLPYLSVLQEVCSQIGRDSFTFGVCV